MDEIIVSTGRLEAAWWGPPPNLAPTLVLLHEGLGCVALWRDFPQRLQTLTGYGVFAYSRFGYGASDPAPLPWSPDYMHHEALSILPEVLDRAGIQHAILLGHSDGGSIAAIYAGVRHDPRLAGVVTIAAHFFVEEMNISAITAIKIAYETTDLRRRLARHHRDPDNAFLGWNGAWLNPAFRDFDITQSLETINVPMLALQGSDDPYGSAEQLRVLQQRMRTGLKTQLIPNARHAPHLEAMDEVLSIVGIFVRGLLT